MFYTDMLIIPDGGQERLFIALLIIAIVVLIYSFAFFEITNTKIKKLKQAKRIAVEGLNKRNLGLVNKRK